MANTSPAQPSLLRKAVNQSAFLKVGIQGFAGSGKTFTAKEIAVGLATEYGKKKPVAFFDTETGSDFLIPAFDEAGVELLVAKSRAFSDLLSVCKEAESTCSVIIVDSVSHIWTELTEAWAKKLNRRHGLEFQDWMKVKREWRRFTDLFLNSPVHMIICGRAGYEYDYERDEETGKKELVKTGVRMKTEGELAYEPSLLIEMERVQKSAMQRDKNVKGWINRATILKDRTDTMDGQQFDAPTYETFRPIYNVLNLGGEHFGIDTGRSSVDMLENPNSYDNRRRLVKVTLEEIENIFIEAGLSTQSKDGKAEILRLLKVAFQTGSWTAIEGLSLEQLQFGFKQIRAELIAAGKIAAPVSPMDPKSFEEMPKVLTEEESLALDAELAEAER